MHDGGGDAGSWWERSAGFMASEQIFSPPRQSVVRCQTTETAGEPGPGQLPISLSPARFYMQAAATASLNQPLE